MDKFFDKIIEFFNVIAQFFKDLFAWKENKFDDASNALSQYMSENANPEK